MRTAAIDMAAEVERRRADIGDVDAVLVTSLMSAADLRALLPADVARLPMVMLMHENQAAYPYQHRHSHEAQRDAHFALTNLTSVLAVDQVLWNSAWNRDSFLAHITDVLRHAPERGAVDVDACVRDKSHVWWLPVDTDGVTRAHSDVGDVCRVVWPHRWEHDKGPETLLRLARRYSERWNLRWTILGESFRSVPRALQAFEHEFADRIDWFGFEPDRSRYLERMAACDWVLSTARHEFFGIAVVEALRLGCLPWLPTRLSYRELLPERARHLHPGVIGLGSNSNSDSNSNSCSSCSTTNAVSNAENDNSAREQERAHGRAQAHVETRAELQRAVCAHLAPTAPTAAVSALDAHLDVFCDDQSAKRSNWPSSAGRRNDADDRGSS